MQMEKSIHLKKIGQHKAKPASEIKVGDTLVWNWGWTSLVTQIVSETPKTIIIESREADNGDRICTQRLLKSRLVAFK